jgi:uncharacterized protein
MNGCHLFALSSLLLAGIVCGAAPAAKSNPSLDADSHLLAWLKFDETSGTTAADASGHARAGTLEGGLAFDEASVPGRHGRAIQLDGKTQLIRISGFKGVTGTRQRSVSAWIRTRDAGGEIVSWGTNDAGRMFIVSFIRGRVGLTPRGGYLYMKATVHDDAWHHIAIVVSEAAEPNLHDDVRLYRDGERAEIDDIGLLDLWPIDTGDRQDVIIGRRFRGAIDDLRIYDRALSDDEVRTLHGHTGSPPSRP